MYDLAVKNRDTNRYENLPINVGFYSKYSYRLNGYDQEDVGEFELPGRLGNV
jgi:hypothetical protein